MRKEYVVDGSSFSDFEGMIEEFNTKLFGKTSEWNGNLDAFNDMLWGGYGTPDETEDFTIIWKNSHKSIVDLGHSAMLKWLKIKTPHIHPSNTQTWNSRIDLAKEDIGETLFQLMVEIIVRHKNITLVLC